MIASNLTLSPGIHQESDTSYTSFTYCLLLIAVSVCATLQYVVKSNKTDLSSTSNAHFRSFQRKYFVVYFLALFGDWLQGPYIYKLYSHYGFTRIQIAMLYVTGFSASMLFGTGAGALADRFGRKRMCMVFCLTYSLCCFLKMFPNYNVLLLGRLLGGISTSLLFSVFESWYIYEHVQNYDFPKEWISITFSTATFWNGILAIVAGIIANFTSDVLGFGPVSPFLLAIPCFVVSCVVMSRAWNENYVKKQQKSTGNICFGGLQVIFGSKLIFFLCVVQSLFESVMYVFVFLWTPILDSTHPPLGIVFSLFMVCIMIGSSIYQLALFRQVQTQYMLLIAIAMATLSQFGLSVATSHGSTNIVLAYFSFFLLEVAVGIYFPAIGYIKSEYIPESQRANIMNWFRVPLNIITCLLLLTLHRDVDSNGTSIIFLMCSLLMMGCSVIMFKIIQFIPSQGTHSEQLL